MAKFASSPSPVRQRRKEARPGELTAAALTLFVEKGFAATRLEDVARLAGVSKGTLYLYFDGKEALFEAVVQEGILPALAEGEAMLARHEGAAAELLRQLVLGWWQLIGTTRLGGIPKLVVSEARNFPEMARYYYENVIRRGRALLGAALERGMRRGEFRILPIDTAIDVVIAPVLMLAIWRHSMASCEARGLDPELFLQTYLDLLLNGLVPVGPHHAP